MKNTMKYNMLAGVAALSLLTGCEHEDLCYDHSHVVSLQVIFDWRQAPEADPASMSLYLFPKSGGEVLRYEFIGRDGGQIVVPIGSYDAVCLNSDTEGMSYRNTERFETFEVTTHTTELLTRRLTELGVRSDTAPRAEGTGNERISLPADMLWSGSLRDIALAETDVEPTITLTPAVSVCHYRVEITDAENVKYVKGLSASLSSLSGGVAPASGRMASERVTLPFTMQASADYTTLSGELLTFGHCPDTEGMHTLIVYALLDDGNKIAYTCDTSEVTRQIHEAPDPRNVVIRLSGLPLPEPIPGGGGFQPSVDEWEEVGVDIIM